MRKPKHVNLNFNDYNETQPHNCINSGNTKIIKY